MSTRFTSTDDAAYEHARLHSLLLPRRVGFVGSVISLWRGREMKKERAAGREIWEDGGEGFWKFGRMRGVERDFSEAHLSLSLSLSLSLPHFLFFLFPSCSCPFFLSSFLFFSLGPSFPSSPLLLQAAPQAFLTTPVLSAIYLITTEITVPDGTGGITSAVAGTMVLCQWDSTTSSPKVLSRSMNDEHAVSSIDLQLSYSARKTIFPCG